ncbi:MAG: chorismate-binding protein [Candidatus Omnitrophica bacterium]|nr:chorismate-binding protein [Candidatus Omnitrophota bacterium]
MRYGLEEAKKKLVEQLEKAVREPSPAVSFPVALRFKVPLIDMDPLDWLLGQKNDRRVFFSSTEQVLAVAGVGASFEVASDGWHGLDDVWSQFNDFMSACPEMRIFVGMSFARSLSGIEWDDFSAIRGILPAVEVLKDKQGCWLVANMVRGCDGEPFDTAARDILEKMYFVEDISRDDVLVVAREDVPDYEDWICSSEAVLDAFERGDLHKVVLARRVTFELDQSALPPGMLKKLIRMEGGDVSFFFSVKDKSFIPVVMDPLYTRQGARVVSRVIVDTRGQTTDKNLREHRVVAGAAIEVYRELCRSYQIDCEGDKSREYEVLKIYGDLNEGVIDKDFLQALHPAASVCGVPAEKSRHFLQQYEVFDRGWFSGPAGFLSKNSVCLAVSSKACLLEESCLHIFAGAPFIKGADPLEKWEDSGARMKNIFNVVHGVGQ